MDRAEGNVVRVMDTDILEAFITIRRAFQGCNLEVPEAVILKSHEEGMRLLASIHQNNLHFTPGKIGKPIEHPDGSVWMEMEVVGIKVRWLAMKFANPDGGYVWQ